MNGVGVNTDATDGLKNKDVPGIVGFIGQVW